MIAAPPSEKLPTVRIRVEIVAVALILALSPCVVRAQGNFEIQVYGAETVPGDNTMVEIHSNTAVLGTTRTIEGVRPTEHAWHETLELTHGFTDWFEIGFYTFTSIQPREGWEWVGNHLRPRVRVPESWGLPVGLSLSTEVGYQERTYSTDAWTLEIRPIIDQKVGRWYWAINPAVEVALEGTSRGFEFAPAVKIGYDVTKHVSAGIEYYGSTGPIARFDRLRDQEHLLFAAVDLEVHPRWEVNVGVGAGLTAATDSFIVKMILGYRFGPEPKRGDTANALPRGLR
jgi:hypothetical protein